MKFLFAVLLVAACGSSAPNVARPGMPALVDAPYEPANDRDLDDMRDRYEAMDPGTQEREALRRELAGEYARRLSLVMERGDDPQGGYERLLDLVSLWRTAELEAMSDAQRAEALGPYVPGARKVREHFARTGGDTQATAALLFLAMADPEHAAAYRAELDEIFLYADNLARSEYGDGAENSRTIEILGEIVNAAPMPEAVDRLLELLVIRQDDLFARFRKDGPSRDLIRAHGDSMFKTSWHMVKALALAGRLDRAPEVMGESEGPGSNNQGVRDAMHAAMKPGASEKDWLELIELFTNPKSRDEADTQAKWRTVLALCGEGSRRIPTSAELAVRAGQAARELNMLYLAIRRYEEALARDPDARHVAEILAELYRTRVDALVVYERPLAATKRLAELEAFHARAAKRWPKEPLESDLADAYASMGRGMLSLGELGEARRYLEKSLALRPTMRALEQLGTLEMKQDHFARAAEYYERATDMAGAEPIEQYNRARLLRLASEALDRDGKAVEARHRRLLALAAWLDIHDRLNLTPPFKAEMLIETGKVQWTSGSQDTALTAFDLAVDIDPDGADTHSAVVSFLIVRGEYEHALDTYHRALGNHEIDEYSKVYLSLWMLAEARRTGRPADPLVMEYLGTRKGALWHHALAEYAAGKRDLEALRSLAKTRGHRAELLYYSAVLDRGRTSEEIRALLKEVLATDMVIYYEYEMAKYWLAKGFAPAEQAGR